MPQRDAAAEFLARIAPAPRRADALAEMSVEDLAAEGQRLAQIGAALPLTALTPAQRKAITAPQPEETSAILHCAAEALGKYEDAQAAIGAGPALFIAVADQTLALHGLCVQAEQVERSAAHGALLLSEDLAAQVGSLRAFAEAAAGDPDRPATERAFIESSFAAPRHLEGVAAAKRRRVKQRGERRLRPQRERLALSSEGADALDAIDRFLARVRG